MTNVNNTSGKNDGMSTKYESMETSDRMVKFGIFVLFVLFVVTVICFVIGFNPLTLAI